MYKLIFDSEAISFLEKAEKVVAKRIWNKVLSTKENPHQIFERLVGRKDYKLRVGDYRVVADIDDSKKEIVIALIGHRKNIYKK
jgi:mRNA interferase RelE/StbE